MFYKLYCDLCEDVGLTPSGAASAIGFNRATVTTWKNTKKAPKGDLLLKIAKYFDVPVDFLLQRPPFEYWDEINADRRGFLNATGCSADVLQVIWGINILNPYTSPLKDFINFISYNLLSAIPNEKNGWIIENRASQSLKESRSINSEHEIKNPDIRMIARAGHKMTPEQAENIRKYAQYMYPEAFEE